MRDGGVLDMAGLAARKRYLEVRARPNANAKDREGYAAVDALAALMILTTTLVCALSATHQGLAISKASYEARRANDLVRFLLETAPTRQAEDIGVADGLSWRRSVSAPQKTFGSAAVCLQSVEVTGTLSNRLYDAQQTVVCAEEAGA